MDIRSIDRQHRPWKACGVVLLLSLCMFGCHYDGSTLNMNSDAPRPFLGLQWSVDSGTRRPASRLGSTVRMTTPSIDAGTPPLTAERLTVQSEDRVLPLTRDDDRAPAWQSAGLVPTSAAHAMTGNVRYAIPVGSLPRDGRESARNNSAIHLDSF